MKKYCDECERETIWRQVGFNDATQEVIIECSECGNTDAW